MRLANVQVLCIYELDETNIRFIYVGKITLNPYLCNVSCKKKKELKKQENTKLWRSKHKTIPVQSINQANVGIHDLQALIFLHNTFQFLTLLITF